MNWAEFTGPRPSDVKRAWACMHDEIMAVGAVFEMVDGPFKAIYSIAGQVLPFVDGPYKTLDDAKGRVEHVVATKMIRPRMVILDQAFF